MFEEKKSEDPKLKKGRRLTKMRLLVEDKNADKMNKQLADKEELLKKLRVNQQRIKIGSKEVLTDKKPKKIIMLPRKKLSQNQSQTKL